MFYFSELKNKPVLNEKNKSFAKVKDYIFLANETALLTKLVVQTSKKKQSIIPIESIITFGKHLKVDSTAQVTSLDDNELSIATNLLDKQIIDVKGGKVVRVNDVAIAHKEDTNTYYVAGVDIGFRAVLRWIGLEHVALPFYRAFNIHTHPHNLSWADIEPLELIRGTVQLKKDVEDLERMRPEDLADYLEKTNIRNVNEIIDNLDEEFAANVIADLNVNYQTTLFRRFASEKGAKLVTYLDPDEAVDILLTLTKEKRSEIMALLDEKKKKELHNLISYSKTPIGELINPEYITILSDDTVGSAKDKIASFIRESYFSYYIYILNNEEELIGAISLAKLLKESDEVPIYKIMEQDVVVIHLTTPKEIATKKMLRYKRYALPVIEGHKKLIGIVRFDDLVEDILKKI